MVLGPNWSGGQGEVEKVLEVRVPKPGKDPKELKLSLVALGQSCWSTINAVNELRTQLDWSNPNISSKKHIREELLFGLITHPEECALR